MNKPLAVLMTVILIIFIVFLVYKPDLLKSENEYTPSEYELSLIEYFKEIALNTEFDDNPERVIKWRKTMSLFVYKEKEYEEQMGMINIVVDNINLLASDGFKIKITNDLSKSNAVLYLCEKERVRELAPNFYKLLNDDVLEDEFTGMTYVEFKWSNFVINKALIFIDANASIVEQEAAIVEEITQSIGLLNDSEKYPDSIFYEKEGNIDNKRYSPMDIDIISLLYNDKMKPGFKDRTVEVVIKKILREKKEKLEE